MAPHHLGAAGSGGGVQPLRKRIEEPWRVDSGACEAVRHEAHRLAVQVLRLL